MLQFILLVTSVFMEGRLRFSVWGRILPHFPPVLFAADRPTHEQFPTRETEQPATKLSPRPFTGDMGVTGLPAQCSRRVALDPPTAYAWCWRPGDRGLCLRRKADAGHGGNPTAARCRALPSASCLPLPERSHHCCAVNSSHCKEIRTNWCEQHGLVCQIRCSRGGKLETPEENPSKSSDGNVMEHNHLNACEIYFTTLTWHCEAKLTWINDLYSGGYL